MPDIPCSARAAVITLHVHTPGWEHTHPDRGRVQSSTHQALQRLRPRLLHQPTTHIARTLGEELARVTGGHLAEEDLPMAAAAVHRGDDLEIILVHPATPCTTLHPTRTV